MVAAWGNDSTSPAHLGHAVAAHAMKWETGEGDMEVGLKRESWKVKALARSRLLSSRKSLCFVVLGEAMPFYHRF
jgi:hypothetical protein